MEHQVRLCEGLVAFLGVLSLWIRTFSLTANVCNFWSEPPWILQLTSCLITIFTALIQASMSKATFLAAFTISVLRGRSAISLKSISNSSEIWMCWVAIDHRGINGFWKYKYLVCSAVAIGIRVCLPQRFQRNYSAEKKKVQSWLFPMAKSLRPSVKARTFTRTPPRKTNGSSQWWVYTNRVHLDSQKNFDIDWLWKSNQRWQDQPQILVAPHSRLWVAIVASSNMRRPRTSASLHRHKVPPA